MTSPSTRHRQTDNHLQPTCEQNDLELLSACLPVSLFGWWLLVGVGLALSISVVASAHVMLSLVGVGSACLCLRLAARWLAVVWRLVLGRLDGSTVGSGWFAVCGGPTCVRQSPKLHAQRCWKVSNLAHTSVTNCVVLNRLGISGLGCPKTGPSLPGTGKYTI